MKRALDLMVALGASAVLAAFFLSCAGLHVTSDNDATLKQLAKTAGFALGAYCLDNDELREKVEEIYMLYEDGQIDPTEALNIGLGHMLQKGDLVQVILAHQILDLLVQMGADVNSDFKITLLNINPELLAIGKDAYLQAFALDAI